MLTPTPISQVPGFWSRITGRSAAEFGVHLADSLARRYPVELDQEGRSRLSAERLARILEQCFSEASAFRQSQRLGWFSRARMANAFKWSLLEAGYSAPFVDLATEGLVVYLNRPPEPNAAIDAAQRKRERKAGKLKTAAEPAKITQDTGETAPAKPAYSRAHPSPRYQELTRLYRQMHEQGENFLGIPPEQTFPGQSLPPQAARIKRLIDATGSRRILDYGSGKGQQYQARDITLPGVPGQWPSIQAYWGVDEIVCYDPAYPPYSELPRGAFDGVISTDVLEHCPEEDIPWILDEIFSYARKFVFANVACYPAKKRLPTGENAHCTIRPLKWWEEQIHAVARKHPGVNYEVWIQWKDSAGKLDEKAIRR